MKIILFLFALLSLNANAEGVKKYELDLRYSGAYKYMIEVEYKNASSAPQCIRAVDMDFVGLGDFILAENETTKLEYKGVADSSRVYSAPRSFIIVLPGESLLGSFYLNDFYKVKGKKISIEYTFPVVACEVIMKKNITLPVVSLINGSKQARGTVEPSYFSERNPDWSEKGFLATSNKLSFSN